MNIHPKLNSVLNEIFRRTRAFDDEEQQKPSNEKLDIQDYMERIEEIVAKVWIELRDSPENYRHAEKLDLTLAPKSDLLDWYLVTPLLREAEYMTEFIPMLEEVGVVRVPDDLHGNFRQVSHWMRGRANRVSYIRHMYSGLPSTRNAKVQAEQWIKCQSCSELDFCCDFGNGLLCLDCYVNRKPEIRANKPWWHFW